MLLCRYLPVLAIFPRFDRFLHVIWWNRSQWLRCLFLLILRLLFKWQLLIGFLLCFLVNNKFGMIVYIWDLWWFFFIFFLKQRWSRSGSHTYSIVDFHLYYFSFSIFFVPFFIVSVPFGDLVVSDLKQMLLVISWAYFRKMPFRLFVISITSKNTGAAVIFRCFFFFLKIVKPWIDDFLSWLKYIGYKLVALFCLGVIVKNLR